LPAGIVDVNLDYGGDQTCVSLNKTLPVISSGLLPRSSLLTGTEGGVRALGGVRLFGVADGV